MNVWLAEQHNMGEKVQLGIFSDTAQARKVCQDSASEYFGEANTPALNWTGDDAFAYASWTIPVTGTYWFHVTRFTVDEVNEVRLLTVDLRGAGLA